MASEFQEISLTSSEISLPHRPITPRSSFRVDLEDRANQIQFIFAVNDRRRRPRDDDDLASDSQRQVICCDDSDSSAARAESISAVDVDDDDDGFRTPTSSDHKIPVVEQCPPAPRRPRPISLSRAASRVSGVRRGFRVVFVSDEIVESIFGSDLLHQKKTKKARKDDNNGGA